ncbi:MAG TPA: hypothetical protein VGN95_23430 [Pyrinomonadaceae bacterium]|nr:hypothetical protein [Pyrinomonadaceae bacterium]
MRKAYARLFNSQSDFSIRNPKIHIPKFYAAVLDRASLPEQFLTAGRMRYTTASSSTWHDRPGD